MSRRLNELYEKGEKISEGVYGEVFKGVDKRTGERVALKRLKASFDAREGFPMMMLREITLLLQLEHVNIVRAHSIVYDYPSFIKNKNTSSSSSSSSSSSFSSNCSLSLETMRHARFYIAMEYVENDLASLLEARGGGKLLSVSEIKCLIVQLLTGLDYLHSQWTMHRDVTPSNLLVNQSGVLKIADLGMARRFGAAPLRPMSPDVATLYYRAPELLLGATEYTAAVDIWSTGCILAELLGGAPLLPGSCVLDQLLRVFTMLGSPSVERCPTLHALPNAKSIRFPSADDDGGELRQRMPSDRLSSSGYALLRAMLDCEPTRRISARDALAHLYFDETPRAQHPSLFGFYPSKSTQVKGRVSKSTSN
jgi:cell division cycle 2-like